MFLMKFNQSHILGKEFQFLCLSRIKNMFYPNQLLTTSRSNEIPDHDRPTEGVDARHFFQERKIWALSQHSGEQCLYQDISEWRCSL